MKPHFEQSDASMNKLAGCNSFPNAGKTFDLTELEQMAREAGCETPFEYLRQRDDRIQQSIDLAAKGYYGHELGCDCAVCENMMLGEACRQREAEHRKNILRLAELVIAAYFRGWKDGSETGKSDSPDWNAAEDWMETDIRAELTKIEVALEI